MNRALCGVKLAWIDAAEGAIRVVMAFRERPANVNQKRDRLRRMLEAHADPARARQEAAYLKLEDREVLGVTMPTVHKVAVRYVREAGLPRDLDLLARWFDASFEEASCAVEFLAAQPAFDQATWGLAARWSGSPDTWALADPLSAFVVAGHLEDGIIEEDQLRAWAGREEPFWFRRIALVSTTSLNGGLGGPSKRQIATLGRAPNIGSRPRPGLTIDPLDSSIHDSRHFIRLGIGWALRELARVAPAAAAEFVVRHRDRITKAMLTKARLDESGLRTV